MKKIGQLLLIFGGVLCGTVGITHVGSAYADYAPNEHSAECTVCSEDSDHVVSLPCHQTHKMCVVCARSWFCGQLKDTCPTCRRSVGDEVRGWLGRRDAARMAPQQARPQPQSRPQQNRYVPPRAHARANNANRAARGAVPAGMGDAHRHHFSSGNRGRLSKDERIFAIVLAAALGGVVLWTMWQDAHKPRAQRV